VVTKTFCSEKGTPSPKEGGGRNPSELVAMGKRAEYARAEEEGE